MGIKRERYKEKIMDDSFWAELQCPKCKEGWINPVKLKCFHYLCQECEQKLTEKKCPQCETPYTAEDVSDNMAMKKLYGKLKVQCDGSCQRILLIDDLGKHRCDETPEVEDELDPDSQGGRLSAQRLRKILRDQMDRWMRSLEIHPAGTRFWNDVDENMAYPNMNVTLIKPLEDSLKKSRCPRRLEQELINGVKNGSTLRAIRHAKDHHVDYRVRVVERSIPIGARTATLCVVQNQERPEINEELLGFLVLRIHRQL